MTEIFSENWFWLLLLCMVFWLLTYLNQIPQSMRFVLALAAQAAPTALAFTFPMADSLLDRRVIEDSPVRLWICLTTLQFLLAIGLALSHKCQVKRAGEKYFGSFDKEPSVLIDGESEGESRISLLLYLIYGAIAMTGATFSYFVIGQRFNLIGLSESFVFSNNQGFTAALSLLIIILTSTAVPIYTDLAKQITAADQAFEHDVSLFAQHVGFLKYDSDAMWRHFASVSYSVVEEWKATIDQITQDAKIRERLGMAFHHHIFLPYEVHCVQEFYREEKLPVSLPMPEGYEDPFQVQPSGAISGTFEDIDEDDEESYFGKTRRDLQPETSAIKQRLLNDDYFLEYLYGFIEGARPADRREEAFSDFLKESNIEQSKNRIKDWLLDWELDYTSTEPKLSEEEQIRHSRRLEFIGWALQQPPVALRRLVHGNRFLQISWTANGFELQDSNGPARDKTSIVSSTEFVLFSVLEGLGLLEEDTEDDFVLKAIKDFRSRVNRHLNDFAQVSPELATTNRQMQIATVCDRLEIDASAVYDDMLLFQQLEWAYPRDKDSVHFQKKDDAKLAAKVRFLHYALWFIEASDGTTHLGKLLTEPQTSGSTTHLSHTQIIESFGKLYDGIDQKFLENSKNVEKTSLKSEFLFLLLADPRSALYNWLRAARADECRKQVKKYAEQLNGIRTSLPHQLGLTILPTRAARQQHLRWYIKAPRGERSPLRLHSIYDVRPDIVLKRTAENILKYLWMPDSYRTYRKTIERLQLSLTFERAAVINRDCLTAIASFLVDGRTPSSYTQISERCRIFCNWINNAVFSDCSIQPGQGITELEDSDFKVVLTTFFHLSSHSNQFRLLALNAPKKSESGSDPVWKHIYKYCISLANSESIKELLSHTQSDDWTGEMRENRYQEFVEAMQQSENQSRDD